MPLSLAAARQLAAEVHRQRAMGRDVIADHFGAKQRHRAARDQAAASTFGNLARSFVEEHARRKTRRWRSTARTLGLHYSRDDDEPSEITGGLVSRWRDRPSGEIDGHDIHAVVDEARRHGVPGLGRRTDGISDPRGRHVARTLSRLFSWAVQHRRIATNPCVGVHVPAAPPARDRVLTGAEIAAVWRASDEVGAPFGSMVKLLLLSGARLNEVARMQWSELSDNSGTWTIPASRTKNRRVHVMPLPPLARAVLEGIARVEGVTVVFTTNLVTPVSGFSKAKKKLDARMEIAPWRFHDLRRTCATGMAELGIAPHIVELVLNHVSGHRGGVAGVYNRSELMAERKVALERWATHVEGVAAGRFAKVVDIRRRRARR